MLLFIETSAEVNWQISALAAATFILDLAAFIRCTIFYSSKLWKDTFADVSLLVLSAFS
jgi:hypothetical protein